MRFLHLYVLQCFENQSFTHNTIIDTQFDWIWIKINTQILAICTALFVIATRSKRNNRKFSGKNNFITIEPQSKRRSAWIADKLRASNYVIFLLDDETRPICLSSIIQLLSVERWENGSCIQSLEHIYERTVFQAHSLGFHRPHRLAGLLTIAHTNVQMHTHTRTLERGGKLYRTHGA